MIAVRRVVSGTSCLGASWLFHPVSLWPLHQQLAPIALYLGFPLWASLLHLPRLEDMLTMTSHVTVLESLD